MVRRTSPSGPGSILRLKTGAWHPRGRLRRRGGRCPPGRGGRAAGPAAAADFGAGAADTSAGGGLALSQAVPRVVALPDARPATAWSRRRRPRGRAVRAAGAGGDARGHAARIARSRPKGGVKDVLRPREPGQPMPDRRESRPHIHRAVCRWPAVRIDIGDHHRSWCVRCPVPAREGSSCPSLPRPPPLPSIPRRSTAPS